uniref:Reverse transcriptase domain-containing protein n=1 Tax=Amphiprion percula TaxID=161767 RepID=A0A3P8SDM0_AMPPE
MLGINNFLAAHFATLSSGCHLTVIAFSLSAPCISTGETQSEWAKEMLFSSSKTRKIRGLPGGSTRGSNINNIRCADDTVLMANSEENLQTIVSIVNTESQKLGLYLNKKKTEVMVILKKNIIPTCSIELDQETQKQVHHFKHLGSWMTSDRSCETDIRCRVAMARTAFMKMKNILTNENIVIGICMRTLSCYILPVLIYGCES